MREVSYKRCPTGLNTDTTSSMCSLPSPLAGASRLSHHSKHSDMLWLNTRASEHLPRIPSSVVRRGGHDASHRLWPGFSTQETETHRTTVPTGKVGVYPLVFCPKRGLDARPRCHHSLVVSWPFALDFGTSLVVAWHTTAGPWKYVSDSIKGQVSR